MAEAGRSAPKRAYRSVGVGLYLPGSLAGRLGVSGGDPGPPGGAVWLQICAA